MDEQVVRDVVMRALATLREWNALPSVDLPPVALAPLAGAHGYETRVVIEMAQAAQAADIENVSAEAYAAKLAAYLSETVDLVPAYSEIARVEAADEGLIRIYLREG
ncbi:MAG TPA: hypothetical protein VF792_08680 [Ktedonobacterales bacterium]